MTPRHIPTPQRHTPPLAPDAKARILRDYRATMRVTPSSEDKARLRDYRCMSTLARLGIACLILGLLCLVVWSCTPTLRIIRSAQKPVKRLGFYTSSCNMAQGNALARFHRGRCSSASKAPRTAYPLALHPRCL